MLRLIRVAILLAVSMLWHLSIGAQGYPLPADLIFSVGDPNKPTRLMIVNAQTLTLSLFYEEPNARQGDATGLQALKWSPDGQKLALLRREDSDAPNSFGVYQRLCILSRAGMLQTCMMEEVASYRNQQYESQAGTLTWSADSESVFYVSSLPEKTTIRLIEANALTGQTVRVLFEYPLQGFYTPPLFIWHLPDLLIIGATSEQAPEYPLPFQQRSLMSPTDEGRDLYSLLPSGNFGRLCPNVSPNGNYYIVMNGVQGSTAVYIFGRQGQIAHIISATPTLPFEGFGSCPIWISDETGIIFTGRLQHHPIVSFFYYNLETRSISLWYRFPENANLREMRIAGGLPYQLSPDNQYLAATNGLGGYVVVYSQTADPISIGNYQYVDAPLWVPPLP